MFTEKIPRNLPKSLLELISEFIKVTEYKINIQKSIAFQYTSNEHEENKNKNIIPLTITQKKKLRCKSEKACTVQDLYTENYPMLVNEIKQNLNK